MVNFTEYKNKIYKELPKVHFDICNEALTEALEVGMHDDYIGPEEAHPSKQGYKRYHGPIWSHPDKEGKLFHFAGTSTPTEYDSFDSALDASMKHRFNRDTEVENLANHLSNHYHPDSYTPEHKAAVSAYTSISSDVNRHLMNGRELSPNTSQHVSLLDSALSQNKTPDDLVVYSGTNLDHADALRGNDVVSHPSYISSSLNITKALAFARDKDGDVIKIHIPKGYHGLYAGQMSDLPKEREFILPRNLKLRIDHSKREVILHDMHKSTDPIYVHHAYPVEE